LRSLIEVHLHFTFYFYISHLPVIFEQRVDLQWMSEYTQGQSHELYLVPMSASFHHRLFPVAAHVCYLQFGVCLLGVQTLRSVRTRRRVAAQRQ
jgi:hypothetical protein